MFPNIFALGVKDLDNSEVPMASGIINTMIVGGAVLPLIMGYLTDSISVHAALIVPIAAYLFIVYFGMKGSKIRKA
jgi:FHS family L-fucose permease-like MFS transporter